MCTICNLFGGNNFAAVLRHIGTIHRYDPGLVIRCGIDRCPQTYSKFESYRSHIYRKHKYLLHSTSSHGSGHDSTTASVTSLDDSDPLTCEMDITSPTCVKHLGAKFILKTREEYRISQSTLTKIIGDVKGMWTESHGSIKTKVMDFATSRLSNEDVNELVECFDSTFPLEGLETEYMQLKYYKEHLNYLV